MQRRQLKNAKSGPHHHYILPEMVLNHNMAWVPLYKAASARLRLEVDFSVVSSCLRELDNFMPNLTACTYRVL